MILAGHAAAMMGNDSPPHPKIQRDDAGNLLLNFGEYGQEVELACFSGDGTRVLTVEDVGVARVWDVTAGRELGQLRPTSPLEGTDAGPFSDSFAVFIEAAALSRCGELALLGLNDGTAGIFTVGDGERCHLLHDPDRQPAAGWELVRAVCFAPDDEHVAVGFRGRSVGLWNARSGALVAFLRPPEPERLVTQHAWARDTLITSVSFSADGRYVFAGGGDLTALIWSLESGELVFEAHEHAEAVISLFADDERLCWATTGGSIWRADSETRAHKVLATGENWAEVRFSPDGRALLSRDARGLVKRRTLDGDVQRAHQMPPAAGWAQDAISLGYDATGQIAFFPLAGDRLGLQAKDETAALERSARLVRAVISPDAKVIATEGWSELVEIWELPSGRLLHELAQGGTPGCLAFSRDGQQLAVGLLGKGGPGATRSIAVWSIEDGQRLHTLRGHQHQVQSLAFGPDGTWLVSASLDGTVRFWDLPRGPAAAARELSKLEYRDLEFDQIHALRSGTILVFRKTVIEAWHRLQELLWRAALPPLYRRSWVVTPSEDRIICQIGAHSFAALSSTDGAVAGHFAAEIPLPEQVPAIEVTDRDRGRPTAAAVCWRGPGGPHLHIGDGPRGWAVLLTLCCGDLTVVPFADRATTVRLRPKGQEAIQDVPFAGTMRASCVTERHVLLINSQGRIFRADRAANER